MDDANPSQSLRLRIDFAYDGSTYAGWAIQPGLTTIEGELTAAWERILRTSGIRLTVAGRTDAGVHARGAVAHLDVPQANYKQLPGRSNRTPADAAVTRLRGVLPPSIVVRTVREAPHGFDARFSAVSRRYSYRICDRPEELDPLRRHDTVVVGNPLDEKLLGAEARSLKGLADFGAFCKKREGATTIRTLLDYDWRRAEDGTLVAHVVADAFCHSMVRSLVGAVLPVAQGRRPAGWAREVLLAGRRDPAVTVMPPHGLVLEEVAYPPDTELADRALAARAVRTLPAVEE